jgi:HSP20 family protein
MSRIPDDPFERIQREAERMFRDLVYRSHPAAHFAEQPWAPPTDLMVSGNTVRVIFELAGVPRESVHVRMRGNMLEIIGRRSPVPPLPGAHYHRAEIYFGEFRRLIELPWEADADSVKATYRDGMLEVRLVAAPAPRRTQIPVRSEDG